MTEVRTVFRLRRGGLLLETLVAMAIFIGVATFSLAAVRDGIAAAERARLRLVAVGLASSRVAEVEAGIVSPWSVGEVDAPDGTDGFESDPTPLRVEMEAARSGFDGLVRVVVSVFERNPDGSTPTDARRLARLVALVPDIAGEETGVADESEPGSSSATEESSR
ncbi:MAG: hypothetical protein CMJ52_07380 [Planctomycetaceae bacterium]|nr:hypothetical protein [Planctomycetaceae bacterium]